MVTLANQHQPPVLQHNAISDNTTHLIDWNYFVHFLHLNRSPKTAISSNRYQIMIQENCDQWQIVLGIGAWSCIVIHCHISICIAKWNMIPHVICQPPLYFTNVVKHQKTIPLHGINATLGLCWCADWFQNIILKNPYKRPDALESFIVCGLYMWTIVLICC